MSNITSTLFYYNVDFDLNLSGKAHLTGPLKRAISEFPLHGLLSGTEEDSLVVEAPVDNDFLTYLKVKEVSHARPVQSPFSETIKNFSPFGWDQPTLDLAKEHLLYKSTEHPAYSTIKKVNSKLFSAQLAIELGDKEIRLINHEDQLQKLPLHTPMVLKALHGNSTNGNKLLFPGKPLPLSWVREELKEHRTLILEPLKNRTQDVGTRFLLNKQGGIENIHHYQLINSPKGSFTGICNFSISESDLWSPKLMPTVEWVAEKLHNEGYFGPVNIDSFEYTEDQQLKFRPLVEINARKSMATLYQSLMEKLSSDYVLWKFYQTSNFELPSLMDEAQKIGGALDYDPKSGTGILFTSPHQVDSRPLQKMSVAFAGNSRNDLEVLENKFLAKFQLK